MSLMEQSSSRRELGSPLVEFGSTDVQYLPADSIRDLTQIRQTYDPTELAELADRIPLELGEEGVKFQLINPPTVAIFDEEGALLKYLNDHSRYYQLDVDELDFVDVPESSDGVWHIRVNGHRRGRAIELKCRNAGIPLHQVMVASTILRNPSFDEARQKQYIENTHAAIKPAEDANALLLEYVWRWGVHPSVAADASVRRARIKELSDFTGHSVDKVKAALMYVCMPEDIRAFTKNGLSYSNVVSLGQLREAYANVRGVDGQPRYTNEDAEQRMRDFFEGVIMNRLKGAQKRTISGAIKGKLDEVTKEGGYVIEELFAFDVETERKRARQSVRREIAEASILALQFADLDEERIEKIMSILSSRIGAKIVALADESTPQADLFSHDEQ